MSEHIGLHDISPEFRERLEWQVASDLRRENRFAAPVTGGRWRRLRVAVVLLCTLGIGAIGGVASAQVQDTRQRSLLLLRAQSEMELLQMRLQLVEAEYTNIRNRAAVGTATREEVREHELRVAALRAGLQRAALQIQEIQATGAPPATDLTAPPVDGRDFVGERLRLDVMSAEAELVAANAALQEAERRQRLGLASSTATLQAQAELMEARNAMEVLRTRLALRQRFLDREVDAERLAMELRRAELRLELQLVELRMRLAGERVERVRDQVGLGQAAERDQLRAELEVLELQADLEILRRELELLGGGEI